MSKQLAGADLARSILNAHRDAARAAGIMPTVAGKPPVTAARRRRGSTGRDPVSFADVVQGLTRTLTPDAAGSGLDGGSIVAQWPSLCPQFVGRVEPVRYDPQRGRLDLRPVSHAYAAQLRLLGGQLAKQINSKLGRDVVRTIRVLAPGALTATGSSAPVPVRDQEQPVEAPKPPVKTRDMASPGYRATLAAALAHKPERAPLPGVQDAIARQDAALAAAREPERVHADRVALWSEARPELPEPGSVEASRRDAIARKRREQAGLVETRRAFDAA
jgi:hypothetical protein